MRDFKLIPASQPVIADTKLSLLLPAELLRIRLVIIATNWLLLPKLAYLLKWLGIRTEDLLLGLELLLHRPGVVLLLPKL